MLAISKFMSYNPEFISFIKSKSPKPFVYKDLRDF